jgi:pimeloyl-ACP methyl ester carboxylesterase
MAEGSKMVVIDDAGHFMNVEQPGVVNRHIVEFLAP